MQSTQFSAPAIVDLLVVGGGINGTGIARDALGRGLSVMLVAVSYTHLDVYKRQDYIYEPDAQTVVDELLVRYVEALVYQAVAENMASEQSARMVAMKSASDNAKNVIGELQLSYNKARQAAITKELSEIVGGAAAV